MPSRIRIDRIDHIVLTVADITATCAFYERVLGMETVTFAGGRKALSFGQQKINLHPAGREYEPHAGQPTPGSADLCLIADVPLDDVMAHLKDCGISLVEGPTDKTGALGPIRSVYFRDLDGNLVEVSTYSAAS